MKRQGSCAGRLLHFCSYLLSYWALLTLPRFEFVLIEYFCSLVEFASGESAQRVIEKMSSGHEIDGQPVQVCPLILIVAFISTYTYKQTHTAICCQLLSEVK